MRLIRENITKEHKYENGIDTIYVKETKEYLYESEAEKREHAAKMLENGYIDSEREKINLGSVMEPRPVWFGSYSTYGVKY